MASQQEQTRRLRRERVSGLRSGSAKTRMESTPCRPRDSQGTRLPRGMPDPRSADADGMMRPTPRR